MKFRKPTRQEIHLPKASIENDKQETSNFHLNAKYQSKDIDVNSNVHLQSLYSSLPHFKQRLIDLRSLSDQWNDKDEEIVKSNGSNLQSIGSRYRSQQELYTNLMEKAFSKQGEQEEGRTIKADNINGRKLQEITRKQKKLNQVIETLSKSDVNSEEEEEVENLCSINFKMSPYAHFRSSVDLDKEILKDEDDDLIKKSAMNPNDAKPIHILNEPSSRKIGTNAHTYEKEQDIKNDNLKQSDESQIFEQMRESKKHFGRRSAIASANTKNDSEFEITDIKNDEPDIVDTLLSENNLKPNDNNVPINLSNRLRDTQRVASDYNQKSLAKVLSNFLQYLLHFLKVFWFNQLYPLLARFFTKVQYINPYMRPQFHNQQIISNMDEKALSLQRPVQSFMSFKNYGILPHEKVFNFSALNASKIKKRKNTINYEQVT